MNTASIAGLSPKAKPTAEIIARACERYGFGCQFGTANKHPYAEITVNRQTRKIYFSSTPSDYRSRLNTISDLKKTARALGWEPNANINEDEDTDMTQTVKSLADLPRLGEPGCPPPPDQWAGKPIRGRIRHPDLLAAYAKRNRWIMEQHHAGMKHNEILGHLRTAGWDITSSGAVDMVVFKEKNGKYSNEEERYTNYAEQLTNTDMPRLPRLSTTKRHERELTEAATDTSFISSRPFVTMTPAPASEGLDPLVLAIATVIAPLIREQLAQQAKQMETYKAKADKWDAIAGLVRDDT
jgi:hypothetical protein